MNMTPVEFERLYRGYLLRQEGEWDRVRVMIASQGKNIRPEQIMKLPLTDALSQLAREHQQKESEAEIKRLQAFKERLDKKRNGKKPR